MTLITPSIRTELTALYNAPDRFYHNLTHVTSLLTLLATHRAVFTDPDAVEAAIWFHDVIYDTHAKGSANEDSSATLAVEKLSLLPGIDSARMAKIKVMIEATATHKVPEALLRDAGAAMDTALFLDMDLTILGAEEDVFDAYEVAVRREYAWVGEDDWRDGRGKVLRSFLDRDFVFQTELFRGLFEEAAKKNLRRAMAKVAL
jgi:predicted metal-dependent HD superfamily phosphohydrolase